MTLDHRGIGMTSQRSRNRLVDALRAMGIESETVLELIRSTPRHLFVDEALGSRAYENTALPIGHGQTISQPYIVAQMTEALLDSGPMERVLEVGAGCGYQSAILARLARQVYAIERLDALARKLRTRLQALQINNVVVRHGDGMQGWPSKAPFDAILVAAAPVGVPLALLEQLADGGRIVIPVGRPGDQDLRLITREANDYTEQSLERVSFVPLLAGTS
ncbi:MAG: protein-L-isoaspartate(D-aspartate) O-methyltransferase [Gammaproteobacteria bacterium]|nr:protein-L-isoaspartate(D-aspartate) O-methyltransferase [Gammaproteobacteria bacterium]